VTLLDTSCMFTYSSPEDSCYSPVIVSITSAILVYVIKNSAHITVNCILTFVYTVAKIIIDILTN
jgi:hypothetical protein